MRVKLLIVILTFVFISCNSRDATISVDKRPIKTYLLKKNASVRNAFIQAAYTLRKKSSKKSKTNDSIWELTFSDDFDSLDLKKWRPGQAWGEVHPANLHQYYDASEVQVRNGYLFRNGYLYLGGTYKPKNIVVNDSLVTVPYAIGLINSDISFKQKYGYFEIRSKNPQGPATWPAFWLTGAHRWPPEIDIFEMYGRKTGNSIHNQYACVHWGKSDTRSRGYLVRKINLPNNTDTAFHVYACEWNPNYIKFYTDGKLSSYMRVNKRLRQWMDDEMVVIINNCFEAKYLEYLPKDFKSNQFVVDYVRVWRKRE